MKKNILSLVKLTKEKAGHRILDQFYMDIFGGEMVNLIGLEGSGKEEIYSILFGYETADSGEIYFLGERIGRNRKLPVERREGIFFIGNHDLIIPNLTVAENMYIVEHMSYLGLSVSAKKMEQQAQRLFEKMEINIDPGREAKNLPRYEYFLLRLMRAYVKRAKLIVIDDILDDAIFEKIYQIIEILNRFKEEGIAILWLNGYPDTVTEEADRVVVIRGGRNGEICYKKEWTKERLIRCLAGERNPFIAPRTAKYKTKIVFEANDITNQYFTNTSFFCREGEILGIYDIQNKFSRELRRLLLGRRSYRGEIIVGGKPYKAEKDYQLAESGIGVINGENYLSMIFPDLSLQENLGISVYKKMAKYGLFINRRMEKYLSHIDTGMSEERRAGFYGRGVTRKEAMQILYQRWSLTNPKVLFCFQPFLRLDVISRKKMEEMYEEFVGRGMAIVICSADFTNLCDVCDRILRVENHRIVNEDQ